MTTIPPIERLKKRPDFLAAAAAQHAARGAVLIQARDRADEAPTIRVGFTATKRIGNAKQCVYRGHSFTFLNTHYHCAVDSGAGGHLAQRQSLASPLFFEKSGELFDDCFAFGGHFHNRVAENDLTGDVTIGTFSA